MSGPLDILRALKRDDGTEIEVEWAVEEHSEPGNGWDDPGCGSIVYLTSAEDADGNSVLDLLTDSERERIEEKCSEAQNEIDCEPYDPY